MPIFSIMVHMLAQDLSLTDLASAVAVQAPAFRVKVIKVVFTSNLARVISRSSRGDTRPIQSSSTVDSIMCLLPVCASETRSFIRGL